MIENQKIKCLNDTENTYLIEYRKKFKKNPIKFIFLEFMAYFYICILSLLCGKNIKKSYQRRSALDKKWIISELNNFRKSRRLSDHSSDVLPIWLNNEFACIDAQISLPIFTLNQLGVQTMFCCHGHKNLHTISYAYISLQKKQHFPQDLIEYLDSKKIPYKIKTWNKSDGLYPEHHQYNEIFVKALNDWASQYHVLNLSDLKSIWKR